jgi:hypothetical protein
LASIGTPRAPEGGLRAGRSGWSDPISEIDPLDELDRILFARPQRFRLQFFAAADDHGPAILAETEMEATDASAAIRASADANWPPGALGLRIIDHEGREIFERLRADRR